MNDHAHDLKQAARIDEQGWLKTVELCACGLRIVGEEKLEKGKRVIHYQYDYSRCSA